MSIVLLILKILGIILLVLLGLVILVFLSLMLVPVRYQARGRIEEEIDISVGVSWFLHLISLQIAFGSGGQEQTLRILGIPLRLFQKEKEKKVRKKKRKKKMRLPEQASSREPEKPLDEESPPPSEQTVSQTKKEQKEPVTPSEQVISKADKPQKRRDRRSFFEKIKKIPGMIRAKWETLIEIIKGFWEKLSRLREQAGRIREELGREENWQAIKSLMGEMKRLFRHILPRKIQGELSFGTADPATTGQILGIVSTIPFLYRYRIHLTPDFSSESYYIRGTFRLKGHARGIHAVISWFSLFRDKNIRKIIQRYRNS
ncbi:MAG: DUF2953 domain-containing protein [Lachnospiraceae bacterium]|nr:DUF2953 domain-containing protein [Lachnospiraceae bacterium]